MQNLKSINLAFQSTIPDAFEKYTVLKNAAGQLWQVGLVSKPVCLA